jgi:hypothetical protein
MVAQASVPAKEPNAHPYAHPYYWSAFMLVGKRRRRFSVNLKTGSMDP